MNYDFDQVLNRLHTGSVKWDKECFIQQEECLPMWVADMDFPCANAIQEALKNKVNEQIYGYPMGLTDDYRQAVCQWFDRRFAWTIDPTTIFYAPGVVSAISYLIEIMSEEGDGIVIQTPVYHPFKAKIQACKRQVVENPLINTAGYYTMDFNQLEELFARSDIKGMILCSPHNPVGRVWTKKELRQVITLANQYGKWLICDEIHCDIIKKGYEHTSIKTLKEATSNIVVCTAASKTFNLAGLQNSHIIIEQPLWQKKWKAYVQQRLAIQEPNSFAIAATQAAYTKQDCEDWLSQVIAYIDENEAYVRTYLKQHLPKAVLSEREGTYLLWLDLSAYVQDEKELEQRLLAEGLIFSQGYQFGEEGKCFERINIACPRSLIETCVKRLCNCMKREE